MLAAFAATSPVPTRASMTVGINDAGHPLPDARSVMAAHEAIQVASAAAPQDLLVVLLSGGASALMAQPAYDLPLEEKQRTVQLLMEAGADIAELNTVRKHLSAIKGGRLAAACAGSTLTLTVSDVVGDDLSVIGSGPTVPDPTTWGMALGVLERRGGKDAYPDEAVAILERGVRGMLPETPKPGDPRLARSRALVIGGRANALGGARRAAQALGYHVDIIAEPIIGDARAAARTHLTMADRVLQTLPRPACILSAGETTVRVVGQGTGGRNQEFALALAEGIASLGAGVAVASVGTDGVDGPTDAAGAVVDDTTPARARAAGLAPSDYLNDNNSYAFFHALNDLIRLGRTDTNVGDIQVVLVS